MSETELDRGKEPVPPPAGTLFLMTLYLALLAGMWGAMYLQLLER